jgi:hypothetical protein
LISCFQKLSEDFILEFQDKVSFYVLPFHSFTPKILEVFHSKVEKGYIRRDLLPFVDEEWLKWLCEN